MEIQLRSHRSCFVYHVSSAYFRHNTSYATKHDFTLSCFVLSKYSCSFCLHLIHFKNMKNPSSMNEKLRMDWINDLIKITHFHKRIILHKIFKLNQRMSLAHEKRSIFPKTKYDHLPYVRQLFRSYICYYWSILMSLSDRGCRFWSY